MLDFQYKAKDKTTGRVIVGTIQADNEMAAGKLLLKQDLYPLEMKPKKSSAFSTTNTSGKVKTKHKVVFTRQLATLIKAGLPVASALNSSMSQVDDKRMKAVIFKLTKAVEGGTQLSQALEQYPESFNSIYISMVQAGEASGNLEVTLERLANQLEKEAEIASKVRGALIYPMIVLVVIMLVMGFMMTSVVPQIAELYKSFGKPLPFITQALMFLSSLITKWWFITLPALVAIVYGVMTYLKTPAGKRNVARVKLTMPPFNQLFLKMYMARFARTLGSLVASGIPILESLKLVSESLNNEILKGEVDVMTEEVKSGRALSEALQKTEYFLPLVSQMIKVGEDSGTMSDMLDRLATFYENEVDQAVKNISTIIEPVLIVFMGGMVMLMIVGILYPVYGLVGQDLSGGGTTTSSGQ
ncbi:MAG: Phytochrome sensor protein [Patescibacteria group bacterium]|jgi:type IV pilus assembly protein PilC|nr:Phytochrome sensor protein [Patescibacteria group bacterium]